MGVLCLGDRLDAGRPTRGGDAGDDGTNVGVVAAPFQCFFGQRARLIGYTLLKSTA